MYTLRPGLLLLLLDLLLLQNIWQIVLQPKGPKQISVIAPGQPPNIPLFRLEPQLLPALLQFVLVHLGLSLLEGRAQPHPEVLQR